VAEAHGGLVRQAAPLEHGDVPGSVAAPVDGSWRRPAMVMLGPPPLFC
jgi:hypothetical protein